MCRQTFIIALLASCLTVVIADNNIFECSPGLTDLTGDHGFLLVTRKVSSCGFKTSKNFFVMKMNDLKLALGERIEFVPSNNSDSKMFEGPNYADYVVTNMVAPTKEISFHFDNSTLDNSSTMLEFFQGDDQTLNLNIDRTGQRVIKSLVAPQYNLKLTKSSTDRNVLLRVGSKRYLVEEANMVINIKDMEQFQVDASVVSRDCSKKYVDVGADLTISQTITEYPYKCAFLFDQTKTSLAHYDVSFKNFIDLVDASDELEISDGTQILKVTKFTAKDYDAQKPTISFKGPDLVVKYESPRKVDTTNSTRVPVKLTVSVETQGGLVDKYDKLVLPTKGQARYSLQPPNNDVPTSLKFTGKLAGADLKISDGSPDVISLTDKMHYPPEIGFQAGRSISLMVNVINKVSGTIEYAKQENSCSGTLFRPSGTISISGAKKTCYWLLGANSTLDISSNDLGQKGCLEIHSLSQEAPIFSRCDIGPSELLPRFLIGPAYLRINTSESASSSFVATVSQPIKTLVQTSTAGSIKSVGYPSSYVWSETSDTYQANAKDKVIVLSVADLDLREGEKLMIGASEVKSAKTDYEVANKTMDIKVQRSSNTKDFSIRRGFSVVSYEFQQILSTDTTKGKTNITTPQNMTSLLLKVTGAPETRLSYSMKFSNTGKDYQIRVLDDQSLSGRQFEEVEMDGSTTANSLLVSYISTKVNTTLPVLTLSYSQIACNRTSDHICDKSTRCVPADKMCKGKYFCADGSDLKVPCSSGPPPSPKIIENGVSGLTVFFLSILMLAIGALTAMYGPDLFKSLETRFRSGQYTTFSSTE